MSPSDRREAQRRRAESRRRRREGAAGKDGTDASRDPQEEQEEQEEQEAPDARDEPEQPPESEPEPERPRPQAREQVRPEPVRGAPLDESLEVVRRAREHLQALQGHEAESVSSLERTSEGWRVVLEVVELARVPDSTDVMASYEVLLDEDKNVGRYAQTRRYYRAQAARGDA